ncbi:MAG: NTP transferase domain-containing protein [Prevotella sp.]|jgi:NDP-sugar pyrophosphorylase family protein|nr:NTP transferase domain-containing protein [Prevotella sp.]
MNYAIIAAGEGSRLVQEGVFLPKPLVRIDGKEMIGRLLDIFLKNEAESISIIINEEMKEVQDYISKSDMGIPFNVVVKSTPSSMHSLFELRNFLRDGKFCLTTVDTVFDEREFSGYIQAFINDSDNDGMMAVTGFIDDEKPLYVDVDSEMDIKGFSDSPDNCKYISGGIYGLTPKAIDTLEACLREGQSRMRNFQRRLVSDQLKLKAFPFTKIVDVDHVRDIEEAEKFINS